MPCWEINRMSVEFEARNMPILLDSLTALKISFTVNETSGIVRFQKDGNSFAIDLKKKKIIATGAGATDIINTLKQQYSTKIIQQVAKKRNWAIRQQGAKMNLVRY